MHLNEITRRVNRLLAGERLEYTEVRDLADEVIDDVNAKLNTAYPSLSDFTPENYPSFYPDYAFFPEEYMRSVMCKGIAHYFYITDEEGLVTATGYAEQYENALYEMLRDYGSTAMDGPFSKDNFDPFHVIGSQKLHEDGISRNRGLWQQPRPVDFYRINDVSGDVGWVSVPQRPVSGNE